MKKLTFFLLGLLAINSAANAQQAGYDEQLKTAVSELDKAEQVADFQKLESYFVRLGEAKKTEWLPWYYAAFCNAKIGFLFENDGERIEPFSNRGEQQIKKAFSLLDTASQKQELSEVYVVMNMINQSKVFINPMTYGPKYGPLAHQYLQQAKRLNPENPRVIYLEAWHKDNAPKMWGGDKDKAKELAGEALKKLAASASTGPAPHWGKKECTEILNQ